MARTSQIADTSRYRAHIPALSLLIVFSSEVLGNVRSRRCDRRCGHFTKKLWTSVHQWILLKYVFSKVAYQNRPHRRIYGYRTHSFSIYSADSGSHSGIAALPATDKLLYHVAEKTVPFESSSTPRLTNHLSFCLIPITESLVIKNCCLEEEDIDQYNYCNEASSCYFYCIFMPFFHWRSVEWNISVIKHKLASCGQVPNYNKSSIVLIYTVQLSSVEKKNVCNCCVL